MPAEFLFPGNPQLYEPFAPSPTSLRDDHTLGVLGRLGPNVSLERALDEKRLVARDLAGQ